MKLYNGSNNVVNEPKILTPDRRLDFGTGFYLTSSYEQAQKRAKLTTERRKEGEPTVNVYDFNESNLSNLKVLRFEGATKDWLTFVSNNRNVPDFKNDYDVVIGPVANDRTMPVLRLFFLGIYDEEETIKRLLTQKLRDQYTFKTEKAVKILKFMEAKIDE